MYCGGNFTQTEFTNKQNITLNYICKLNVINDGYVEELGGGFNSYVTCLVIDKNGILYAGGNFTTVCGISVNYIAKWDGDNWESLANGLTCMPNTMIIDNNNNLIVGGNFVSENGTNLNHIAKWDGVIWTQLGDGLNGSVNCLSITPFSLKNGTHK